MTNKAGQRTSRGPGSGSRLRLYLCQCVPDKVAGTTNKARVASDKWNAFCNVCEADFVLQTGLVVRK
jgi:hypothetical protein